MIDGRGDGDGDGSGYGDGYAWRAKIAAVALDTLRMAIDIKDDGPSGATS